MSSVVESSSSIYSTYISTIDHLPCDIVRSLWLVQACNLQSDKEKNKMHKCLQQNSYTSLSDLLEESKIDLVNRYSNLKTQVLRCNKEALAELNGLHAHLVAHSQELDNTVASVELSEVSMPYHNESNPEQLRAQLEKHYAENPLKSQMEALQECKLTEKVTIRQVEGRHNNLKIIFKIPKAMIKKKPDKQRRQLGESFTNEEDDKLDPDEEKDSKYSRSLRLTLRISPYSTKPEPIRSSTKRHKRGNLFDNTSERSMRSSGTLQIKQRNEVKLKEVRVDKLTPQPEQYCFCNQSSFGDMIACDNEKCPNGEWFHYKCVGLLNKAEARKQTKQKWYCKDSCRAEDEELQRRKKKKGAKKRKRW